MKKGKLEDRCLWLNCRRAWCERDFVREARFNEDLTIPELVEEVIRESLVGAGEREPRL